jgi:hypothetical protein
MKGIQKERNKSTRLGTIKMAAWLSLRDVVFGALRTSENTESFWRNEAV